jgi:hypothetical protein
MDTFGWCGLGFIFFAIGAVLYLYLRRGDAIPNWPITTALITDAQSHRGLPGGSHNFALALHHCRTYYAFSLNGKSYEGWFALVAEDEGFADTTATKLRGQEISIRYNPKIPEDSVLVDQMILGKEVIQKQELLG